ncbi:unnamed protein product, partial [Gulo gulo]
SIALWVSLWPSCSVGLSLPCTSRVHSSTQEKTVCSGVAESEKPGLASQSQFTLGQVIFLLEACRCVSKISTLIINH